MAIELDIPSIKVLVRSDPNYSVIVRNPKSSPYKSGSYISIAESSLFALTASYAENAGSGAGFPFTGIAEITGSLIVSQSGIQVTGSVGITDTLSVGDSVTVQNGVSASTVSGNTYVLVAGDVSLTFTGSINQGVFGVTEDVLPYISTIEYSGTTIEYVAQRPGATRIGMILATWSGSTVVFTDVSTADIGDTKDISFAFIKTGNFFKLRVNSNGSGSGAWTVQSLFKLFPNLNS